MLIRRETLAKLLGLGKAGMNTLEQQGSLTAIPINRSIHYCSREVNTYFAQHSISFKDPPTVEALFNGSLVLVKTLRVAQLLRVSIETARRMAVTELSAIRLGGQIFVELASVDKWLKKDDVEEIPRLLPQKLVCHILGVSKKSLEILIADGRLICEKASRSNALPVTTESLVALLVTLLPPGEVPQDWIEDRLASGLPLRSVEGFRLDPRKHHIDGLRRITHATKGPRWRLFMPESVLLYLKAHEPAYTSADLMRLWGLMPERVDVYKCHHPDAFICPLHDHSQDGSYYWSCLIAILEKGGLQSSANQWCKAILIRGEGTIGPKKVYRAWKIGWPRYNRLCRQLGIVNVKGPGGFRCILESSVKKLKRQLQSEQQPHKGAKTDGAA